MGDATVGALGKTNQALMWVTIIISTGKNVEASCHSARAAFDMFD